MPVSSLDPTELGRCGQVALTGNGFGSSLVVKTDPGIFFGLRCWSDAVLATALCVQIHDATALPANGTLPQWRAIFPIGAQEVFDDLPRGLECSTGIVIAVSTTYLDLTVGAAAQNIGFGVIYL